MASRLLAIVAAATAILLRRLLPAVGPPLRVPVVVYVAAILAMMTSAATLPALIVVLGAALFVASDAILAIGKFLLQPGSLRHRWAGSAVWILYYLAQLLILLGFIL